MIEAHLALSYSTQTPNKAVERTASPRSLDDLGSFMGFLSLLERRFQAAAHLGRSAKV
jgi:hypothetical protein